MIIATTFLLACANVLAPAQDPPPAPAAEQAEAADPYDALKAEYDAAMQAWNERYTAAETDEERQTLFAEYPTQSFVPRFRAVAEEHAGEPCSLPAWRFVIQNGESADLDSGLTALGRDFPESEELGDVCMGLYTIAAPAVAFCEKVLAGSPHAEARGKACYSLGRLLGDRASMIARLSDMSADERESYAGYYGAATLAELDGADAAALQAKAEKCFERVVADFGDIEVRKRTLGQMAGSELFEIRNLQIGMLAPDIAGEDVDTVAFKLSDLKGKVVVLDFWGDW